ncbi:hypothetical protein HZA99_01530 [Candidatus Woesearchaeota archaeon]|nr:hypothetical protein [Candidatus Woesearchaeota archaeon]
MNKKFLIYILFSMIVLGSVFSVFSLAQETNTTEIANTTETNTTDVLPAEQTNQTETMPAETTNTATEQANVTTNQTTTETNTTINQTEANTTETNTTEAASPIQAISLEKITPAQISVGEQQLNIVLKNIGNVPLYQLEAEVSGYGITTKEKLAIEALPVGEKDYTFTKINAEKTGTIDLIVKIYANGTLLAQQISSIEVVASPEQVTEEITNAAAMNATAAAQSLNETRSTYSELEKEYYQKEKDDYVVYGIKDDLADIKEYLRQAQVALIEQNQKEYDKDMLAAKTMLDTVAAELQNAQKEQKTWGQIISENLTLIGSLFGVIISGVTVWSITKSHLKDTKVVNIIKGKQILNVDKDAKVENRETKEEKRKERNS